MKLLQRFILPAILIVCFSCTDSRYSGYKEYTTTTYLIERSTIPDSVFQMKNLQTLSIGGMECNDGAIIRYNFEGKLMDSCYTLKEIPPAVGDLEELKLLALHANAIKEIPPFLKNLSALEVLSLGSNPIHSLPKEMEELKNLKELYLQDCPLTSIAPVEKLPKLEKLLLQGCPIKKLPDDLSSWKHLKLLGLHRTLIDFAEQQRIRAALPNCRIQFPD